MRLIDSEKLMIAVVDKGQASKRYGIGDFWELNYNEIKEAVDSMPTIDAIPMEWIRKYTEENRLYQSDDFDFYISDMIADWMERKEE